MFTQHPGWERLCGLGVAVALEEDVGYENVLVHGPPQPVSNAIHSCTDLIEMPPGTPSEFPAAQIFSEEGSEFDAPLAERFVADLHVALVEQFLHVSVTQGKAVVQPNSVLDDSHRRTVAVRRGVCHGGSAYLSPDKATQPLKKALWISPTPL